MKHILIKGKNMKYGISETAAMLNLTPSALRYYEKEGLVPFVERTKGGKRFYLEENMDWLRIVDCLKSSGMPIKEIRNFIELSLQGDSTIEQRFECICGQIENVKEQIRELEKHLELLQYKKWYYEKAKEAGTCAVHINMDKSEIPERFRKFARKHDLAIKS